MSFADSHIAAAARHAGEFFGSAILAKRPFDVDFVSVPNAIVGLARRERRESLQGGTELATTIDVTLDASELPGGSHRIDMVYQIDGTEWTVDEHVEVNGTVITLSLTSASARQPSRRDYRKGS